MDRFNKELMECPFRLTMSILEGKWKLPIIYSLCNTEILRFRELERDVSGITPRMLVKELKELEQFGIVTRTAYPTIPPTVEYRLTHRGHTLQPIIDKISEWGEDHRREMLKNLKDRIEE